MSDVRADSPAARLAAPTQAALEAPPRREPQGKGGWPLNRWLMLIAVVFAAHAALLLVFGSRKQIVPRAVANVPTLKLADSPDELLALNDPTLFALPHPGDFVTVLWSQPPGVKRPSFRWTEPPRWLPLSADELAAVFNQFMQTNRFAGFELRLKPPVRLSTPAQPIEPALAQNSTMCIEGDLKQRRLLTPMDLPSWPYADVIAPSKVQVLVDEAGDVVSAILLPSDNNLEALSHYDAADQRALEFARAARFAPAPRLTIGRMIFTWHTVPPPATNSPATSP
jgi:hypothetical protein